MQLSADKCLCFHFIVKILYFLNPKCQASNRLLWLYRLVGNPEGRFSRNTVHMYISVRWPPFIDFTQPELLGLGDTRNFYLQVNSDIRLGVW